MTDEDDFAAEDLAAARRLAASPYSRHEVLHTVTVVVNLFDREVLAHPSVEHGDEALRRCAQKAFESLCVFYNLCSAKFRSDDPV